MDEALRRRLRRWPVYFPGCDDPRCDQLADYWVGEPGVTVEPESFCAWHCPPVSDRDDE